MKSKKTKSAKKFRYGKIITLLIIIVVAFSIASGLFWMTGKPDIKMWMFFSSGLIYMLASVLLTKVAKNKKVFSNKTINNAAGFLLDVFYGIFLGLSAMTAMEIKGSSIWSNLGFYLWVILVFIFVSSYLDARYLSTKHQLNR